MKKYQVGGSVPKWTITNSQLSFNDPKPLKERRNPHWTPGARVRVPHVSWSTATALWAGTEPPLPHLSTSPSRTEDPATTATESSRLPTELLHDQASADPSQPPFCHFSSLLVGLVPHPQTFLPVQPSTWTHSLFLPNGTFKSQLLAIQKCNTFQILVNI